MTFANQTWLLSDLRVGYDVYSRIMFFVFNVHPDIGIDLVCVCVFVLFKNYGRYGFSNCPFLGDRYGSAGSCTLTSQGVFGLFMAMFGIAQGKQKPLSVDVSECHHFQELQCPTQILHRVVSL